MQPQAGNNCIAIECKSCSLFGSRCRLKQVLGKGTSFTPAMNLEIRPRFSACGQLLVAVTIFSALC
jgi:hypothetical protein